MGQNFNLKNYFLLIFCISIFSLLSAIYIEFVLDQKPCKLCVYQRVPYIIAIFICFLGFAIQKKTSWLFFLSIILELSHLIIPNRSFEFGDLISNILGIIVAYLVLKIYLLFNKK